MARLTNDALRSKPVNELTQYALEHPDEAGRISRIYASESATCLTISVSHHTKKLLPKKTEQIIINID